MATKAPDQFLYNIHDAVTLKHGNGAINLHVTDIECGIFRSMTNTPQPIARYTMDGAGEQFWLVDTHRLCSLWSKISSFPTKATIVPFSTGILTLRRPFSVLDKSVEKETAFIVGTDGSYHHSAEVYGSNVQYCRGYPVVAHGNVLSAKSLDRG